MLDLKAIKGKVHSLSLTSREKLLICLLLHVGQPAQVKRIRKTAHEIGFKGSKSWNISRELGRASGLAISVPGGWELTGTGEESARISLAFEARKVVSTAAAESLRNHLSKITDKNTRDFLGDAISCLDAQLLRAAVVLSWVGAVSVLQEQVLKNHLAAFNAEAAKRDPRWKVAKNADDLSKMKEATFLIILESISMIGKNVKQELEACLTLRNACGHPNSLKIGDTKVAAHVETLMQNVFEPF